MKVILRSAIAIIYILSFSVMLSNTTYAQAPDTLWTKTFGGSSDDEGRSVEQTSDGGYIITGYTNSFGAGESDVWLIKTDTNGDTLWTKTFGDSLFDEGHSVQQTTDGGYIIVGMTFTYGIGSSDVWLIKTDAKGDTLWTKTFGGNLNDWGNSIRQTTDAGYIMTGRTKSWRGFFTGYIWLIKTDANGDTLWTKTFGQGEGLSVQQTSDSGYILTGRSFSSPSKVWLIKTNSSGDTLWTRTYGGEFGSSVKGTTDDGFIITGSTESVSGYEDVYLIRTNANGDILWTHTWGGYRDDFGNSVQQTIEGGFILTGRKDIGNRPYPSSAGIWLIKTDNNGDTLWTDTFGGGFGESGNSVLQTLDNGYIIAGTTTSRGSGGSDVCLIRVAPDVSVIEKNTQTSLDDYELKQNYPNPFNPNTNVEFSLSNSGYVTLKIYNLLGEEVATLFSESIKAGNHTYTWDASGFASGVYYYRIEAENFVETRKMIYLK
jgi:hypothetical protein